MTEDEMEAAGIYLINSIFECVAEIEARHGPMPVGLFLAVLRSVVATVISRYAQGNADFAGCETAGFCERLRVQVARHIEGGCGAIHH